MIEDPFPAYEGASVVFASRPIEAIRLLSGGLYSAVIGIASTLSRCAVALYYYASSPQRR